MRSPPTRGGTTTQDLPVAGKILFVQLFNGRIVPGLDVNLIPAVKVCLGIKGSHNGLLHIDLGHISLDFYARLRSIGKQLSTGQHQGVQLLGIQVLRFKLFELGFGSIGSVLMVISVGFHSGNRSLLGSIRIRAYFRKFGFCGIRPLGLEHIRFDKFFLAFVLYPVQIDLLHLRSSNRL